MLATVGQAQHALAAQAPALTLGNPTPGTQVADQLVAIHTAASDGGVDYGVWAAGPGFKVSFHDGATFVPMLGKDYPHNQPLRWRTVSARVGELELATQAARLSYQGLRAEYDLGSIVEAYDVGKAGVEQTFVLAARPGTGNLVIRGVVDSMLQSSNVSAAHQSLAFVDAQDRHLVSYGKATAIDARGYAKPMTTCYQDGEITLRLDAVWLASATYPVVVDPLLGIGTQVTGNTRDEVDLIRDSETTNQAAWMAYSTWSSATDRDVFFRRYSDLGVWGASVYADVTASWSSQGARAGYSAGANHAVIVFDRIFTVGATRRLRYHRHSRTDFTNNTSVASIPTTDNAWRCDVGGAEQGASGPEVLVVWQQESNSGGAWQNTTGSGIRGCLLDIAAGVVGPIFPIATSSLGDEERPRVNQYATGTNPNNAHWLVAYQTFSNLSAADDWDVGLRQVDLNGNVSGQMFLDNFSNDHKMSPIVSGSGSRYLVAFTTSTQLQLPGKPMDPEGHKIQVVRVDWDPGAASGTEPHGTVQRLSLPTRRARLGDVAFDRESQSHWGVLHQDTGFNSLHFATIGYQGEGLHYETVQQTTGTDDVVLGGLSFNEFNNQFMIAYGYNSPSSNNWVAINRWAYPQVTPWSLSGTGCSSANFAWSGSQYIGAELGSLEVSGAAANALHVMLMATDVISLPLNNISPIQNGCWLLVPNAGSQFVGTFGLQIGSNASYPLPLPSFLSNATYYFQDFHTVAGATFELVSTPRLELPIAR
tara:strand:+ start:31632 stop:33914 length:2283 start_codon:yes stop_codon:yes gene_type:complete